MLNQTNARKIAAHVIDPVARGLLSLKITPDMVTIVGTIGVTVASFVFLTRGMWVAGVLVISAFIFSDMLDGTMARLSGRSGKWGAFLDSSLDRVADAAIFSSLLIFFVSTGQSALVAAATICLIGGALVSYAKARAEGLGMTCNVGFAERTERLILVLVPTFLGTWVPYLQAVALWVLAALTVLTVFQRFAHVYRQASRPAPPEATA